MALQHLACSGHVLMETAASRYAQVKPNASGKAAVGMMYPLKKREPDLHGCEHEEGD